MNLLLKIVTESRESILIDILDTAGLYSEYCTLLESNMRRGEGFLCVYSVGDVQSYEMVDYYISKITLIKPKAPIVLVSNKCDIVPERRTVDLAMGHSLSEKYGIPLIETSAKLGLGIEKMFEVLIRYLQMNKNIRKEEKHHGHHCCTIC